MQVQVKTITLQQTQWSLPIQLDNCLNSRYLKKSKQLDNLKEIKWMPAINQITTKQKVLGYPSLTRERFIEYY